MLNVTDNWNLSSHAGHLDIVKFFSEELNVDIEQVHRWPIHYLLCILVSNGCVNQLLNGCHCRGPALFSMGKLSRLHLLCGAPLRLESSRWCATCCASAPTSTPPPPRPPRRSAPPASTATPSYRRSGRSFALALLVVLSYR